MTRHALTEDFDNRDVALGKGELVIILENERSGSKNDVYEYIKYDCIE